MKYNLKNRPFLDSERFKEFSIDTYEDQVNKYLTFIGEESKWFEGFFLDTIPRLLKRIDNFKDSIPVDVANQIIREEILGE